ncbi:MULTISPECIES: SWIM zinc finger family protein [Methanobacterium]|jgi:uncharacterized Zn finger protein|uniref:SWIM zinc finger family protein n=1 Tax=Methanobacterium veterum TaxID=408577 RepID=A0A9E5DKC1_9EURY|nr:MULTISPECIES: SWIM zinc finger family protein [Methanobacterium]MCZ3364605.1 SWIM zinc finger family protein [Methanobacterium veterum]MCZ3372359.1 SWIM zinc finger family protein [Methanobacterium veterum]
MGNRMNEGFKLYMEGNVEIELFDDDLMIFSVHGSRDDTYQVSMNENMWLCDCDDYQYRSEKEPGSFVCKHLWAAFFKVAELKNED